jgi:hypothetical protein
LRIGDWLGTHYNFSGRAKLSSPALNVAGLSAATAAPIADPQVSAASAANNVRVMGAEPATPPPNVKPHRIFPFAAGEPSAIQP